MLIASGSNCGVGIVYIKSHFGGEVKWAADHVSAAIHLDGHCFAGFLSKANNCDMTEAIAKIKSKFSRDAFEFSLHATDQTILRGIGIDEIKEAIQSGEIIEDHPDDKYGPSCLIFGLTLSGRPLHNHCSDPKRSPIKIITVYAPVQDEWINYRVRR
jgi:hypothetical protein